MVDYLHTSEVAESEMILAAHEVTADTEKKQKFTHNPMIAKRIQ